MEKSHSEKAFYFRNKRDKKLFGFYHQPTAKVDKGKGIVICAPIFEERVFAYLFLVNFAREACRHGYHVFRFDYYGYGDSEGDAGETTVGSMLSDIEDALACFLAETGCPAACLLGYRFGATLAALFAEKQSGPLSLVLWDPIVNAGRYVSNALRQAISTQTLVFRKILLTRNDIISNILADQPTVVESYDLATIDGYPLTRALYEELVALDLMNVPFVSRSVNLSFLLQPKRHLAKEQKIFADYLAGETDLTLEVVEEEVVFWKDNLIFKNRSDDLFNNTLQWLVRFL